MSRVHDALRKATQDVPETSVSVRQTTSVSHESLSGVRDDSQLESVRDILVNADVLPYTPLPEALLVNPSRPPKLR